MSVNKVILIGRLGRDPETRTVGGGSVVTFSLATSETWRDKDSGERKEKTEWHNVVIWNEVIGKIADQYLKKGKLAYIEGQIQTREYKDKDGNERKTTEIVLQKFRGALTLLSEPDGKGGGEARERSSDAPPKGGARREGGGGGPAPFNDDIPF